MNRIIIRTCVALLAAGSCNAAFLAASEFMGFSPGGAYAAFGQYWIQDGSGFPGAEIRVMYVPEGTAVRVFESNWTEEMAYDDDGWLLTDEGWLLTDEGWLLTDEGWNPAWTAVLEEAGPLLDSLGIKEENTGSHCLCHLLTDRGVDPCSASFVTWMGSPSYTGPEYTIALENRPSVPEDPPEWLSMFDEPVELTITIRDLDGRLVYSHSDQGPEPGYEYISSYSIADVYVYDDSLAAMILHTTGPGFEGPDGMFRIVTGVMDTGGVRSY